MGARGTGFYTSIYGELDEDQLKILQDMEKTQEELMAKDSFSLSEFGQIFRIEAALTGNPTRFDSYSDMEIFQTAESRNNPLTEKVLQTGWLSPGTYEKPTVDMGIWSEKNQGNSLAGK